MGLPSVVYRKPRALQRSLPPSASSISWPVSALTDRAAPGPRQRPPASNTSDVNATSAATRRKLSPALLGPSWARNGRYTPTLLLTSRGGPPPPPPLRRVAPARSQDPATCLYINLFLRPLCTCPLLQSECPCPPLRPRVATRSFRVRSSGQSRPHLDYRFCPQLGQQASPTPRV